MHHGAAWAWWTLGVAACLLLMLTLMHPRTNRLQPVTTQSPTAPSPLPPDTILVAVERLRDSRNLEPISTYTVHTDREVRLQVLIPSASRDALYTLSVRNGPPNASGAIRTKTSRPLGGMESPYLEMFLTPGTLRQGSVTVELTSAQGSYQQTFLVQTK
jgi:hypothetical protein